MSSFTTALRLEKNANDDETWGDAARNNLSTIDYALHAQRMMFVDPLFSTTNLYPGAGSADSERRHWNTIQGAIDQAETNGWGEYLVLIAPGDYSENLVITESVTLAAWCGITGAFYPSTVMINGQTSVADSVITLTPASGQFIYVQLLGLALENHHTADVANPITEPYLIDAQDQASYSGTRSKLVMRGCHCRMQTWGGGATNGGNVWTYGIKAKGNWHVVADNCQFDALSYGGGQLDGIVRRIFHIEGNNAQSITAVCNLKRCNLNNASYDDGTTPILLWGNNRSQTFMNHCATPFAAGTAHTDGGTGTNVFLGMASGDAATYMNAFGVSNLVVSF